LQSSITEKIVEQERSQEDEEEETESDDVDPGAEKGRMPLLGANSFVCASAPISESSTGGD
jgi:hypothetical protein